MSIQPPNIDNRTYDDIVAQTIKLVQHFTAQNESESVENQPNNLLDRTLAQNITDVGGNIIASGTLIDEKIAAQISEIASLNQVQLKLKGWYKQPIESNPKNPKSPIPDLKSNDAGLALIRIFGRMAETVSDRLNRVPEKNFLAFLDLLGTQIIPPQPARVPLTFYLASSVPENTTALVPAYTTISAPPAEGEEEEVVFETESDLIVTPVQLQAVFVRQYSEDKYSDCTLQATGKKDTAFLVFTGDTALEHSLYLDCEPVFSLSEVKTVTLNIYSSQVTDLANLPLTWSYWNGITWKKLDKENKPESDRLQVTLKDLPAFPLQTVNHISARWLKVELDSHSSLSVERITASVDLTNSQLKLDQCFFNTVPLDLNKDFYPFGEQPRFNDTFYFASKEIFPKPDVEITLNIQLSKRAINTSGGVEIAWEFYNGANWETMGKSSTTNPAIESQPNFSDDTQAFTKLEEVTWTIPDTIQPVTINGVNNYWLRARIVTGNYGTEATYRQRVNKDRTPVYVNEVPIYELVPATFGPPSIQSISLGYRLTEVHISDCLSYNNFTYQVHPTNFQPFARPTHSEPHPTLYLGFARPFPNRAVALYFQVETPTATELSAAITNAIKPRLVWEYFNGKVWTKLNTIDETAAFSDRGLIKFIGPSDFTATQEFNQTLYWLRVRWESGDFRVLPRLRRILTNTIWASQTTTLHDEILRGSNGNPNQTFRTVRSPILPGQQLEVQEQKILSSEEQQEIEKLEGKDAITIVRDEKGEVETLWVRWHEVADFYQSGTRDRHYKINRLTGEIQFGDGQYGLIPPQGRNNIRMARYKTDGGAKGNKFTNTINQLKTTIPYIDRVTNLEAAGGGSDREPIDRVKERGQKFIRHRNRAVTIQDFEDLAYEASADIARVKAIAPNYNPLTEEWWLDSKITQKERDDRVTKLKEIKAGLVKLFIVSRSDFPQPIPSMALIERVENYIRDRASPTINLWVGSPQWLQVSVRAEVVPTSLEFADLVKNSVIQRLQTFLHPITGGVSGQGWEFGREPQESDFYALIEAIDRVDYVRFLSLKIAPEPPQHPEPFLIFSGSHNITVFLSDIGG